MTYSPGRLFRAATRRWLGPFAASRKIVKVTVRDQEFRIVRELTSQADLTAFRELWSAMVEADRSLWSQVAERRYYKLSIESIGRGGRTGSATWFYFSGGYIKLLAIWRAIWVAPLYRTASPTALETTFSLDPL